MLIFEFCTIPKMSNTCSLNEMSSVITLLTRGCELITTLKQMKKIRTLCRKIYAEVIVTLELFYENIELEDENKCIREIFTKGVCIMMYSNMTNLDGVHPSIFCETLKHFHEL